jgi:hypothetical protein
MTVELTPITVADVPAVADFLHANLNRRVPALTWTRVMSPPWKAEAPNHGFMLRDGQRVVGAYLAFYSERPLDGRIEKFCNLASWAVLSDYRFHSVRLLKALLAQDGYHFTDLAPSAKVEAVNARLKFGYLDTSVAVIPNLPWPTVPGRTRISADAEVIRDTLAGRDLELYRDHERALAARHLVLIRGRDSCYVMFRERWWRGRPMFAAILYVSDPGLFHCALIPLTRYFLLRHHLPVTLTEFRIVGRRPRFSVRLPYPETVISRHHSWLSRTYAARYQGTIPPKMYRSRSLVAGQIDDLYSELVCVPDW